VLERPCLVLCEDDYLTRSLCESLKQPATAPCGRTTDRGHVSSVLGRYRWPTWVNRHGFTKPLRKPGDGLR
jgi:hypothetical protein